MIVPPYVHKFKPSVFKIRGYPERSAIHIPDVPYGEPCLRGPRESSDFSKVLSHSNALVVSANLLLSSLIMYSLPMGVLMQYAAFFLSHIPDFLITP